MKKTSILFLAASVAALSSFTVISLVEWEIADGHSVQFEGAGASGEFENVTGTVYFEADRLQEASCIIEIEVASIATGNFLKNIHAEGEDWFDADTYPSIRFKSSRFNKTATGYEVAGMLDMHGVQKNVLIPFTFSNQTFKAKFSVKRMDYGIGTLEGMSKKVANEISLDVVLPVLPINRN